MKGKKRLIALLLSFLMVLSQMSVATFALDTVADDGSDQTVEEQAVEESQPEADLQVASVEAEPEAAEPAAEPEVVEQAAEEAEKAVAELEAAEPATEEAKAEEDKVESAKAEEKKAEPAKAEEKKAEPAKTEEKKAEVKEEAFDQSQTVDGVTVNVSAARGVFPAGSKLSVSKVAVPAAVDTSDAEKAYAFDISILADGKKIQPDGNATVSFTTEEVADYDTAVYHMDGGAQKMSVSESGETASVKTDGFSVYVVKFERWHEQSPSTKSYEKELNTGDTETCRSILQGVLDSQGEGLTILGANIEEGTSIQVIEDATNPENTAVKAVQDGKSILIISVQRTGNEPVDLGFEINVQHKHEWETKRSSDKTKVSVWCTIDGCKYHGKKKLWFTADDMVYTGEGYNKTDTIKLEHDDGFPEEFEASILGIDQYQGRDGTDYSRRKQPPKNVGKYYVRVNVGGNYSGSTVILNTPFEITPAVIEVTEPQPYEDLVYDGTEKLLAEDGVLKPADVATLKFAVTEENTKPTEGYADSLQDLKKVDAGTYYIWYQPYDDEGKVFDNANYMFVDATDPETEVDFTKPVEVTIAKADSTVTKAPTTKTLTYNGSSQELVTAGEAEGGQMQYAVLTSQDEEPRDEDWSTSVPAGTNAGDYYVWYRVVGDENHNDTEPDFVKAVINKADPKVTPPVGKTLTYNGKAQELAAAGTTTGGTMVYALGKDANTVPEETAEWTTSVPKGTEVGTYYIWYVVVGDDNYNWGGEPACVISKITEEPPVPVSESTITLDLNGGNLNGQTGVLTMKVENGTVITMPAPTRDGYVFDYWEGSRYNAGDKYTVNGDHAFKAIWKVADSGKKADTDKKADSGKKGGVNTGDHNDVAGLLALMLASIGALGALGYRRRKEDQI